MRLFSMIALLGAVLSMASAAVLPVRQAPAQPQCSPTTVYETVVSRVYIPLVATVPPKTATIVELDPSALSVQAASDAAIDTRVEIHQSEDRQPEQPLPTEYPVHTHELTASAFPATVGANGVYIAQSGSLLATVGETLITVKLHPLPSADPAGHHVSGTILNSINGTSSDTPSATIFATVTYTVSPLPLSTSNTVVEATHGPSYGPPPFGYANSTSLGYGSVTSSDDSAVLTVSATKYLATTTVLVEYNTTAPFGYGSLSQNHPSGTGVIGVRDPMATCMQVCVERLGCWCNNWGGNGIHLTDTDYVTTITPTPWSVLHPPTSTLNLTSTSLNHLAPRQTCTLVSAPGYGTWCNNYEGSTTNHYTVWETTTTPGVPTSADSETTVSITATSTASLEAPSATRASSTTASPTACGQSGPFEVSFDQLPAASIPSNDTQDHPPIDQYIDHLLWGIDWTYGPPPNEPFAPHDQPYLGWYIPNLNENNTKSPSHNTGLIPKGGSFGAGARKSISSFWFNATSAYVACDNESKDPNFTCDFVATGYRYANMSDQVVETQHFTIPPCASNVTCSLQMIEFNHLFGSLSALNFYANVQGEIKTFYIDTLQLDWYDNSCRAGLEREGSP